MRRLIIPASAILALSGCASPDSLRQQALRNCSAVGISQKDPQFETCTHAYRLQAVQDRLEHDYYDATTANKIDPRDRHPSIYVY